MNIQEALDRRPTCPFCQTKMERRMTAVNAMQLPHAEGEGYDIFYALDIRYKCPKCFHLAWFGYPINEEEYHKLRDKNWHGIRIQEHSYKTEEERNLVLERLRGLGYII